MAESIPYAAVANLLSKLATLTISGIVEVFGVKKELKRLEATLSSVKAVLLDAEEQQEKSQSQSHAVKNWIRRLNQVVYDAEDLLDEFQYEDLRKKVESKKVGVGVGVGGKVQKFFSSSNQIASTLKLHFKIKDIRQRLDGIANDISKFNLREGYNGEPRIDSGWRETCSFVLEYEMIGRDKDKVNILQVLLHPTDVLVTAIVGFGGLGKTTLAQLVYNDVRVQSHFDKKMWVCVSEHFNVQFLVKKILECLMSRKEVLDLNWEESQSRLRGELAGKTYLLVLDDVWNEDHPNWVELRKYLPDGASGSKILVTTRSERVALTMDVEKPYILGGLTEEQSWTLFKNFAFRTGEEAVSPGIIKIGEKIAEKCEGVPLALKSLGSMLRLTRSESEWWSVLKSELWELVDGKNNIFPVLKLSYDHLPIYLRQCFSYCAMFPKDYEFDKETLIYLWMAQGFIESKSEIEDPEEIGDRYFNELLFRSFFQEFKYSDQRRAFYKMHDLIHDLAILIAGDSCFVAGVGVSEMTRHVYLSCSDRILESSKGVRTLFVGEESLFKGANFLSNHKKLRTFCLLDSVNSSKTLFSSIGNLKHLRFLDISQKADLVTLPNSTTNLFCLETVVVAETLKRLPRDVEKLMNLKYFVIKAYGCPGTHAPIGLGKMTWLRGLSCFLLAGDGSVTLNELSGLNQLRGNMVIYKLDVAYQVDLEYILKEKEHLTALRLHWSGRLDPKENENDEFVLERLEPHPNLKELHVEGYRGRRFSSWISSIQRNIVRIHINRCRHCRHLQPLEHLPSLQTLHLKLLPALEFISDKNESSSSTTTTTTTTTTFFPSLKEIHFEYCRNLKGWWKRDDDVVEVPLFPSPPQSFPCLSTLFISSCPELAWMPLFPSLDNHLSLFHSSVRPLLHTLASTPATFASSLSSSSSFCIHAPLSKLKILTLHRVYGLESLSEESLKNLTSLQRLQIISCSSLRSLFQGLQHLTFLEELEIYGCPETELADDEDEDDNGTMHWQGLSSLRSFTISAIAGLLSLPDWIQDLTSLQQLTIKRCPHLSTRYGNNKARDWSAIAHIPNIRIDDKMIQEAGNYLLE